MPKMNKKRRAALNRRPDGTFGPWRGGKTKAQLPKQENNFHGIAIHIGKEFQRQRGRTARVGDAVRTKNEDGSYHGQAYWYIMTKNGWRRSPTMSKKPTQTQIQHVNKNSRRGR